MADLVKCNSAVNEAKRGRDLSYQFALCCSSSCCKTHQLASEGKDEIEACESCGCYAVVLTIADILEDQHVPAEDCVHRDGFTRGCLGTLVSCTVQNFVTGRDGWSHQVAIERSSPSALKTSTQTAWAITRTLLPCSVTFQRIMSRGHESFGVGWQEYLCSLWSFFNIC